MLFTLWIIGKFCNLNYLMCDGSDKSDAFISKTWLSNTLKTDYFTNTNKMFLQKMCVDKM